MRQFPRVNAVFAGFVIAGAAFVAFAASRPAAASAAPEGMATALASAGFHLSSPSGFAAITDDRAKAAIDLARDLFGQDGTAVAVPATLTVDGYRLGSERSGLAIEDRDVIAVQVTGLELPPMGGRGTKTAPQDMHEELVVFVDAETGEYLLATTVR